MQLNIIAKFFIFANNTASQICKLGSLAKYSYDVLSVNFTKKKLSKNQIIFWIIELCQRR